MLWYSGLTLNQDKARQRRTGLKSIHYKKRSSESPLIFQTTFGFPDLYCFCSVFIAG
ncbi:hypothetical protein HMPREF1051_1973 [Neisseria sicca VK64]|uniref:Uncharacterized protein n=1 Tax=Neisseria sicca VK64 TaxID=1095748 RepID=I2NU24_NEISI|nr:hypothetical protein HMPREF1051_1973 [Neisseria sicca VK64]